jgi:Mn-dependent DtxR family transcriptional regulator
MDAQANQDAQEILDKLGEKGIIDIDADCNVTLAANGELISEPLDS